MVQGFYNESIHLVMQILQIYVQFYRNMVSCLVRDKLN